MAPLAIPVEVPKKEIPGFQEVVANLLVLRLRRPLCLPFREFL